MRGAALHQAILASLAIRGVDLKVNGGYFARRTLTSPSCWTMREAVHALRGKNLQDGLAVDWGFGTGPWLCMLAELGFSEVQGHDPQLHLPSEVVIQSVKEILDPQIPQLTLTTFEFGKTVIRNAALVTCFDWLSSHMQPVSETVPKIAEQLQVGGCAVFDYYIVAKDGKKRSNVEPGPVLACCHAHGLEEVMFVRRRFQGRDIALYVMERVR